jgi:hypothetical protein
MMNDQIERAATYRENAGTLRRLASQIRFDLCRRQQLGAFARAFDRLAEKLEGSPLKHAAD